VANHAEAHFRHAQLGIGEDADLTDRGAAPIPGCGRALATCAANRTTRAC